MLSPTNYILCHSLLNQNTIHKGISVFLLSQDVTTKTVIPVRITVENGNPHYKQHQKTG